MSKFIVVSSSAKMPSSCWGRYRRVAVLEINDECPAGGPRMISERARGVVQIVRTWEKCSVGKAQVRCAYTRAMAEAAALAAELNAQDPTLSTAEPKTDAAGTPEAG